MMEFEWNATPLLGALGMWSLLVFCGISIANKDNGSKNYNRSIVYLFPWSVLIYAAGGFGYVFALSVDPSFRAWNRISVLILTLGLLMLGILLSRIKSLAILYVLSPLILVVTITTQLFPLSSVGIGREHARLAHAVTLKEHMATDFPPLFECRNWQCRRTRHHQPKQCRPR